MNYLYRSSSPIFQNKISKTFEDSLSIPIKEISIDYSSSNHCYENVLFEDINDDYDFDYDNNQNASSRFKEHISNIIDEFTKRFNKRTIFVEIGCGNGYFLNELQQNGFMNVMGYDKAYKGSLPYIVPNFLEDANHCLADVIILRHTLEHIKNPKSFLAFLSNIKTPKGKKPDIYIEVPNMNHILEQLLFEDVFYEHVNYFTPQSFGNIFKNGDCLNTFDGQYISLFASLDDLIFDQFESNLPIGSDAKFTQLQERKENIINHYCNQNVVIWGCGAKGNTLAFMLKQKNPNIVVACVDVDTNKQGKYLSGSGFLIQSFESVTNIESYDVILVMNASYLNEIKNIVPIEYHNKLKTLESQ